MVIFLQGRSVSKLPSWSCQFEKRDIFDRPASLKADRLISYFSLQSSLLPDFLSNKIFLNSPLENNPLVPNGKGTQKFHKGDPRAPWQGGWGWSWSGTVAFGTWYEHIQFKYIYVKNGANIKECIIHPLKSKPKLSICESYSISLPKC